MDSELLLIGVTTINGYVSQNTDTACYYTKNHFLKFIHLLVGGNISQLVYLTPHPRFWSSDCLHIMKWLWSITLLKMMKMFYNPDIFCLFTLISHLKYLRWWVGGATYPSWFILPPTWIFEQWLAMDSELLLIAVTTINGYVSQNTDTAC